jgi:2,3-bisphosphoglycerate-independent phosphoglycerate mutase
MWTTKNGQKTPMVAHTLNPVPFVVKDYNNKNSFELARIEIPGLANVASTLCVLLGFESPVEYEPSLVTISLK